MKNSFKPAFKFNSFLLLILSISVGLLSCEVSDGTLDSAVNENYYVDYTGFTPTGDQYNEYVENPFINVSENPTSTFSLVVKRVV